MSTANPFPSSLIQALLAGSGVQNRVRTFGDYTLDIELVAIDGLVGAARLGGAEKGPVSALALALAELPPRIKSDLAAMDVLCSEFGRALSNCAFAALRVTSLRKAYKMAVALDRSGETWESNLSKMRNREAQRMESYEDLVFQARGALRRVRSKLRDFEYIVRSSQYVGNYMSIEAASLQDGAESFGNLAAEIHKQSQRLAEVLDQLFSDADRSELAMSSRRGGIAA
jgi:hypothetical protein